MNTVFLQSETDDPFRAYESMRKEHPVYRDEENGVWAIYGYRDCEFFLKSGLAEIPQRHAGIERQKNKYTRIIRENLVRRSNPPEHSLLRKATGKLVKLMEPVHIPEILDGLLKETDTKKLNWSEKISGVLPITVLLKSLRFQEGDMAFILSQMPVVKLFMAEDLNDEQAERLNAFSGKIYPLMEDHFRDAFPGMAFGETHMSNLIGLCIQSYDAMRGLLGNSLLQYIRSKDDTREKQGDYFRKLVVETLRFDPVFHNTRRILTEDVERDGCRLKKGDELLLVLASANRDISVFDHADTFDMNRENNGEYLSFSSGIHHCPADHFSVALASDVLTYMASRYNSIELLQQEIAYAPMANARIPLDMILKLNV